MVVVPLPLIPMAPTLARPFHRPGWVYEEKVDGWRMLAYKDGPRGRLISRQGVEEQLDDADMVLPCRRLADDGGAAWATVEERGLEGFVAKDPASTYRPGGTRAWNKVKVRREGVFVVGGIRDVDAFDGVLVGDELRYGGVVEWGFRAPDVLALLRYARDFSTRMSPFADLRRARSVRWVEPRLLAEVSYAEVMEGRLRATSWRALVA